MSDAICPCAYCGESFTPRTHNAKYCGSVCAGRSFRATRVAKLRPCSVGGCEVAAVTRGWCNNHYQRWLNHGEPTAGNKSPLVPKAIDYSDRTRLCTKCNQRLPIEQFAKDQNATGGRRSQCKECRGKKSSDWYAANRERQCERGRRRREGNADALREYDKKRYEREKPKRIELATESFHRRRDRIANSERVDKGITALRLRKRDGSRCYLCNKTMDFEPGKRGHYKPRRASIEHIIQVHEGGLHVWENVVLSCLECNLRRKKKGGPGGEQLLLVG